MLPVLVKRYRIRPLRQQIVLRIADRLEPFVRAALARCFEGHVRKPAVLGRAMPMLDAGGNEYDIARMQFACLLAPELAPSAAIGA